MYGTSTSNAHRQASDPGGAAGELEESDEGTIKDAKLCLVDFTEKYHPNHSVCKAPM
jgi:hypothetical protein